MEGPIPWIVYSPEYKEIKKGDGCGYIIHGTDHNQ